MVIYTGKAVFGGIAIGRISLYKKDQQQVKRNRVEDTDAEIARYHAAKEEAIKATLIHFKMLSDSNSINNISG